MNKNQKEQKDSLSEDEYSEFFPKEEKTPIEKLGNTIRTSCDSIITLIKEQKELAFAGLGFFVFITILSFIAPPRDFLVQTYVQVEDGTSLHEATEILYEKGYIKSRQFFEFFVVLFGRQKGIKAGEYFFEHKITSTQIAWRLVRGDTRVAPVQITLFEGSTVDEMTIRIEDMLAEFDSELFTSLAQPKEGYLFPDTYHFKKKSNPQEIIEILERTFVDKTETLLPLFEQSGHSIDELVIMASILEKEASHSLEEKKTIAGILWKRLSIDMPLQVDATLKYVTGKGSAQLTNEDLQTDHPYTTYTNRGLPPGPIGNPGLMALRAAADPTSSPYLFYLHDSDGGVHYAKNHAGHLENKRKYIK